MLSNWNVKREKRVKMSKEKAEKVVKEEILEEENKLIEEEIKEEEPSKEDEKDKEEDQKFIRLMAEFQNYKKRVDKEKKDTFAFANEKIVTELLDVIDNFERALETECENEKFYEGMKLIFDQFQGVLKKAGLEEIEAMGEEFNPTYHNAIMTQDSDEHKSGHVINVMQKGYKLKNKVIRPSMVVVAN